MSALLHLYSEDGMRIEADNDGTCVWVRDRHASVSLNLSADDRAKLRAALDRADELQQVAA